MLRWTGGFSTAYTFARLARNISRSSNSVLHKPEALDGPTDVGIVIERGERPS